MKSTPLPIAFIALFFSVSTVLAQSDLPKPTVHMQKFLDEKGVLYASWLLDQGIRNRSVDYVTAALELGAPVNNALHIKSEEVPSLFTAVSMLEQNPRVISLLVRAGANPNARWEYDSGSSLRNRSDLSGEYKMLMRAWNKVSDDVSVLGFAALHGKNPAVIVALLLEGADPNQRTRLGRTALFSTTDIAIAEVLLAHGADVNARQHEGVSVLGWARQRIENAKRFREPGLPHAEAYYRWLVSKGATE